MADLREFLKRNVLGLFGLLVGVVGIGFAYYAYTSTQIERQPVFIVDPVRTEILNSERVTEASIKVTKLDGTEIEGDVTLVKFYLWNDGEIPIRKEHILDPISISLKDAQGEILDFNLQKISREVTDFTLVRTEDDPARTLAIDFFILEKNDGVTGQIIYQGNPEAPVTIGGTIEGVGQFQTNKAVAESRFWYEYSNLGLGGLAVVGMFLLVGLMSVGSGKIEEVLWPKLTPVLQKIFKAIFWVLGILVAIAVVYFLVVGLILGPIEQAEQRADTNVVQAVPATILP